MMTFGNATELSRWIAEVIEEPGLTFVQRS